MYRYYCNVVDECTNYAWIILLRRKSEAASRLIDLLRKSQRKLHADVYKVRRDGGTEFLGLQAEDGKEPSVIEHGKSIKRKRKRRRK